MGSFNPKSEFLNPENLVKPVDKGENFNIAELPISKEFRGNNYAHVILSTEPDSFPTNARQLLEDCGLVGCRSSRSNDLSVHARIESTRHVRLLWESSEDDELTHAAIFDGKFGKKAEEALTDLRERTADTLFLWPWVCCISPHGSDLSITEDNFVPTARCVQDTKKRQLVTRSGLQRLRWCACDLQYEQAMKAPYRVRQFLAKVFTKVQHYKVDVIARDANAEAYKYYKTQEYKDLYNSSVAVMLREMQRVVNMDRPCESRLHIDYLTTNHHSQLRSTTYPELCEDSGATPSFDEVLLRETARQSYPDPGLWSSPIWTSLRASEQRSLDPTRRSILALSYSCDYSWVALKNYRGRCWQQFVSVWLHIFDQTQSLSHHVWWRSAD